MGRRVIYRDVKQRLRQRIAAGDYPPSTPLPAERTLAEAFSVNRLTLRKALAELEQEQVLVRRKGGAAIVAPEAYRQAPATLLFAGETTAHFYEPLYRELSAEAARQGLTVTAFAPNGDERARDRFLGLVREHGRLVCTDDAWLPLREQLPAHVHVTRVGGLVGVSMGERDVHGGYRICADPYRASKLATEHLAGLGHRRIGFVEYGWKHPERPYKGVIDPERESWLGYRAALSEMGVDHAMALAVPDLAPADVRKSDDDGVWHMRCLTWQLDRMKQLPTAFVCSGDFRAAALYKVLRERGLRIPELVSVVGIGNTPWATALDPALTSVCLGETQMAHLALLVHGGRHPEAVRVVRVDPELVVRESTAKVRAG